MAAIVAVLCLIIGGPTGGPVGCIPGIASRDAAIVPRDVRADLPSPPSSQWTHHRDSALRHRPRTMRARHSIRIWGFTPRATSMNTLTAAQRHSAAFVPFPLSAAVVSGPTDVRGPATDRPAERPAVNIEQALASSLSDANPEIRLWSAVRCAAYGSECRCERTHASNKLLDEQENGHGLTGHPPRRPQSGRHLIATSESSRFMCAKSHPSSRPSERERERERERRRTSRTQVYV